MSSDRGYIKVYRDIWDHWIWKSDRPFDEFHAWIDLIMLVNHEDKQVLFDGNLVAVEKGSTITSIRKLAVRWGWSRNHVSDFLDLLEKEQMIQQNRATKKTALKVLNYCIYQDSKGRTPATDGATDRATERATDEATDGAQTIHYKDTIQDTKKKNPLNPPTDDEWVDDPGEDPEESYRKWKEQNGNL